MAKLMSLPFLLLLATYCSAQQKEATPEFPSSDEIARVISQSERVFEQYKQAVTMEAELPTFKKQTSAVEKDRAVYESTAKLIGTLKAHPEGFHGVGGLFLLSSLDDASRNAALCSGTAYSDTMQAIMTNSDVDSAREWIHVGLSCIDVSDYLYTVSESVQALMVRELEAQQVLNQNAQEGINQCAAALKKCAAKNK